MRVPTAVSADGYRSPIAISGLIILAWLFLLPGNFQAPRPGDAEQAHAPGAREAPARARMVEGFGKLPLSFEANQGQTDRRVKFLSRGPGYTLFLTATEAVLALRTADPKPVPVNSQSEIRNPKSAILRMRLVGANPSAPALGLEELPGKSNYFIGNDPKKWRSNVPNHARVRFGQAYPGVDVIYYGKQRQLEYDLVVSPGADPRTIRLEFEGADKLKVDAQGDLLLETAAGQLRLRKPYVYQEVAGHRQAIEGGYVLLASHQVGFDISAYDRSQPLVIDPVLSYSTYLGGTEFDLASGIAVDSVGNAYVTGFTSSTDFPTSNALQRTYRGGSVDAFVTKLNAAGSAAVYSTFLGGTGIDHSRGVAVDRDGHAYVTGLTNSPDFPTARALQVSLSRGSPGSLDAFVAKLDPMGSVLVYSTYLGGSGFEFGTGIAVDPSGNAWLSGFTTSIDFPVMNAFQAALAASQDGFASKLNAAGSALLYSTYVGGTVQEELRGIATDAAGNAYVVGITGSTNFPTTANAFQRVHAGGGGDAVVIKIDPSQTAGASLVYSTYLGGSGFDTADAVAVDAHGTAYVTGTTQSGNFPTVTPLQELLGGTDAFVARIDPSRSDVPRRQQRF